MHNPREHEIRCYRCSCGQLFGYEVNRDLCCTASAKLCGNSGCLKTQGHICNCKFAPGVAGMRCADARAANSGAMTDGGNSKKEV